MRRIKKRKKFKKKKTALSKKQPNSKIRGITINISSADIAIYKGNELQAIRSSLEPLEEEKQESAHAIGRY